MFFDCHTLTAAKIYPLLAGTVVPRPIAWVSTVDEYGRSNLAPFSFFQLVCDAPPTLMLVGVAVGYSSVRLFTPTASDTPTRSAAS